jgi:hypothetical protein
MMDAWRDAQMAAGVLRVGSRMSMLCCKVAILFTVPFKYWQLSKGWSQQQ